MDTTPTEEEIARLRGLILLYGEKNVLVEISNVVEVLTDSKIKVNINDIINLVYYQLEDDISEII